MFRIKGLTSKARASACLALLSLFLCQLALAESFRFGVINERPDRPDHVIKQYHLFHKYLQAELSTIGIDTGQLIIANNITELTELIRQNKIDGFLEGVMSVIEVQRTTPVDLGLLTWRKQQREYFSVFFVRKDSGISDLSELSGKTIVFESPRSTSAFLVPKLTLEGLGYRLNTGEPAIGPKPDETALRTINYRFAKTETNQAYWVHKKIGDIGAFNDGDWERVPDVIRKDLTIVGKSRPILRWLLAYRQAVPTTLREKVNEVLLKMHETSNGKAALSKAESILRFEQLNERDKNNYAYWQERYNQTEKNQDVYQTQP